MVEVIVTETIMMIMVLANKVTDDINVGNNR